MSQRGARAALTRALFLKSLKRRRAKRKAPETSPHARKRARTGPGSALEPTREISV